MLNRIVKGTDTPVSFVFSFTGDFAADGLNNFTDIEVALGSETYTLASNPTNVIVESQTELRLVIGSVTSLSSGYYDPVITCISSTYQNGIRLTGPSNRKIEPLRVF